MFFLFGWGHRTFNERGPTVPANCPNCSNETWLHMISWNGHILCPHHHNRDRPQGYRQYSVAWQRNWMPEFAAGFPRRRKRHLSSKSRNWPPVQIAHVL